MNYQKALKVAAIAVAVLAASRRVPATRELIIPNTGGGFFSFLPFVD